MTKLLDEPEDTWNRFVNKFGGYLPFTALNLCLRLLDRLNRSLLDIGCGKGRPAKFISQHRNLFTVGTDIYLPYLKHCKNLRTHNGFVRCDIRKLPFVTKSFDAVLCKEVLEHLTKEKGEKLLREIENIGRR